MTTVKNRYTSYLVRNITIASYVRSTTVLAYWAYPETHFGRNRSSLSLIYSFTNDLGETGIDWK